MSSPGLDPGCATCRRSTGMPTATARRGARAADCREADGAPACCAAACVAGSSGTALLQSHPRSPSARRAPPARPAAAPADRAGGPACGSCASFSCTSSASDAKPLLMSVWPIASHTRTPAGTRIIEEPPAPRRCAAARQPRRRRRRGSSARRRARPRWRPTAQAQAAPAPKAAAASPAQGGLPRMRTLSAQERADLVAVLTRLSSEVPSSAVDRPR